MFEVYDINTGETMHRFNTKAKADRCRRDMNKGKLDKLYAVRPCPKNKNITEAMS